MHSVYLFFYVITNVGSLLHALKLIVWTCLATLVLHTGAGILNWGLNALSADGAGKENQPGSSLILFDRICSIRLLELYPYKTLV